MHATSYLSQGLDTEKIEMKGIEMINFNMDKIDYIKLQWLPAPEPPHINLYTKFEMNMLNMSFSWNISDQECWLSIKIYRVIFQIWFEGVHSKLHLITTPHNKFQSPANYSWAL